MLLTLGDFCRGWSRIASSGFPRQSFKQKHQPSRSWTGTSNIVSVTALSAVTMKLTAELEATEHCSHLLLLIFDPHSGSMFNKDY